MQSNLTHLREGDSAIISTLAHTGAIRQRLQELGLVSGTSVMCLKISPHADIAAYGIRGAVIAIRAEDARLITIL